MPTPEEQKGQSIPSVGSEQTPKTPQTTTSVVTLRTPERIIITVEFVLRSRFSSFCVFSYRAGDSFPNPIDFRTIAPALPPQALVCIAVVEGGEVNFVEVINSEILSSQQAASLSQTHSQTDTRESSLQEDIPPLTKEKPPLEHSASLPPLAPSAGTPPPSLPEGATGKDDAKAQPTLFTTNPADQDPILTSLQSERKLEKKNPNTGAHVLPFYVDALPKAPT